MLVVPASGDHDLAFRSSIELILPASCDVALAVRKWVFGVGDLLLSLDIVGGRAAFEIDGAVGEQRDRVDDVTGLSLTRACRA